MKRWLPLLLAALLAAAAGAWFGLRQMRPAPPVSGAVAAVYAQHLPDPEGKIIDFAAYRDHVLVLNFWAPWCPPCVDEMPELVEISKEFSAKNVVFSGIGIDSARNIKEFLAKTPVSYPIVVAGLAGTELAKQLGDDAGGLPFTVVISKDGSVLHTHLGRIKRDMLVGWLREAVEK